MFVGAVVAPVVAHRVFPQHQAWVGLGSAALAAGVLASAWAWRRGADAGALAPLVTSSAVGILILYGGVGPLENARRSHRELAAKLEQIVSTDETQAIMFFRQIDEGLWFYLRNRTLAPVPGSQPRYNLGFDLDDENNRKGLEPDAEKRAAAVKKILVDWLTRPGRSSSYVLVRAKEYDLFARDLAGLATIVYREQNLSRNELILLHVDGSGQVATAPRDPAIERSRQ
jgi:hypothetical protein